MVLQSPSVRRERSQSPPRRSQFINSIEFVSTENSKIIAVSVYSGRAEITRVFKVSVQTGQNHVVINGLPDVLDEDSLRVEGRGAATIHDVTVSWMDPPARPRTSSAISDLANKKEKTVNALERCRNAIASVEAYLETMDVKTIDVGQVRQVLKEYDSTVEELDNRVLELEAQLREIEEELNKERAKLQGPKTNDHLSKRVIISVFADVEGEVEIVLIYAVRGASWTAGYDIRVNTNTYEEPVTLIYKAAITQRTGEDWSEIPLTLETAEPTFGLGVPTLDPWNLSIYKLVEPPMVIAPSAPTLVPVAYSRSRSLSSEELPRRRLRSLDHRTFDVVSKGNVSATFQVPGLITIPSDGVAHNVTIAQLKLGATMSWVSVPKKDTRTHLSAKIKNASQYTLLRGTGSVYVDGSFISRSEVPAVSPEESFDCPLGLDPSIRVTYHPLSKKRSKTGFYTKTITHVYTQTVTVLNTKSTPVEGVRIADQIPVSEDAQIQVKLISPALVSKGKDKDEGVRDKVAVAKGVSAMWQGADEPEPDTGALGKNGKFDWVVALPAQGKVNLVLQYEVIVPVEANVVGLA
ncbi:hypothetical protein C0995_012774 [Termitomyces sp. Mi166|nr:hypothetical protein C0995_012774 [Termitomyces sp. Mi166\